MKLGPSKANSSQPSQMYYSVGSQPHLQWLDSLRFLAAIIVVASHVRGQVFVDFGSLEDASRNLVTGIFFATTRLGHEAVIVFFVLSGYFVGGKAFELLREGRFNAKAYIIDRITRLWVPLFPVLIISCIGTSLTTDLAVDFMGNLFGLQTILVPVFNGNGPLWSLAYEQWFYMVPISIALLSGGIIRRGVALGLGAMIVAVFMILQTHYMLIWLAGSATWFLRMKLSFRGNIWVAAALIAISSGVLQLESDGELSVLTDNEGIRIIFEILLALGAALLIVPLGNLKSNRLSSAFSMMAASSYTLYLAHYPFLFFVMRYVEVEKSVTPVSILKFLGLTLLCMAFSTVLYFMFERHTPIVRQFIKRQLLPFSR